MLKQIRRWFRRPSNSAGNVYYVKLFTPQGVFYKIGYTTKSNVIERFAFANCGDEKLVNRQFLFAFREDAWDVEQQLLDHFDKHRAFGKYSNDPMGPLAGCGQSELFRHDILGLDNDLYAISDELAKRAAEVESKKAGEGCLMMLIGLALAPFTLGLSLLFLFGGASGVFEDGNNHVPTLKRPVHPPKIQELIDSLNKTVRAA